jgi:hypothetical protein
MAVEFTEDGNWKFSFIPEFADCIVEPRMFTLGETNRALPVFCHTANHLRAR